MKNPLSRIDHDQEQKEKSKGTSYDMSGISQANRFYYKDNGASTFKTEFKVAKLKTKRIMCPLCSNRTIENCREKDINGRW